MFSAARTFNSRFSAIVILCAFIVCSLAIFPDASKNESVQAARISVEDRTSMIVEEELLKDVVKVELLNLQSPDFPLDLKVRVTNVAKIPIYYILISVIFPETKRLNGISYGLPHLDFGSPRLLSLSDRSETTDKFLKPGENVVMETSIDYLKGLVERLESMSFDPKSEITEVATTIQVVSFGDGTGYVAGDYVSKK